MSEFASEYKRVHEALKRLHHIDDRSEIDRLKMLKRGIVAAWRASVDPEIFDEEMERITNA